MVDEALRRPNTETSHSIFQLLSYWKIVDGEACELETGEKTVGTGWQSSTSGSEVHR